jgi:hypothetical protein
MALNYCVLTKTSLEGATGASASTLVSALDTTGPAGRAMYELVCNAAFWFAQGIADTVFTAVAATDVCTAAAHGMSTGDAFQVSNSGGGLPGGLSAATTYWAIVLDANTFKVATSRANALAGTAIDITTNGTGTQTATTVATAGAGSHFLGAGVAALIDGTQGPKISVIQDAGGGKATVVQVMIPR